MEVKEVTRADLKFRGSENDTMSLCKMRVPVRVPMLFALSRRCGSLEQLNDKPEQARKSGPGADNAEPQHDPFAHVSTAQLVNRPWGRCLVIM